MNPEICYQILGVSPGDSKADIKNAYHAAAKRNHPDLYREAERPTQQLKMMKINEAYLTLLSLDIDDARARNDAPIHPSSATASRIHPTAPDLESPSPDERIVAQPKDPAYVYYKRGFVEYTAGRKTFFDRYEIDGYRIRYVGDNRLLLSLALSCIRRFQKAYGYFNRVVEEYPDSVWRKDAQVRMYYIERYNDIYRRICRSISSQLQGAGDRT